MNSSTDSTGKILNSSNGVICNTKTTPENSLWTVASSRRTRSFCSFSSSSFSPCSSSQNSPLSPNTPLQYTGVPFSWENKPGVPKHYSPSDRLHLSKISVDLLPLPPAAPCPSIPSQRFNLDAIRKKKPHENDDDPFVTALMECSKDRGLDNCWKSGRKVSKTLSFRFSCIDLCSSCKNSCSVSDSTVFLRQSRRRSSYDLLNGADRQ